MKKIKFLIVLGILLCTFFIFNLDYKANASDNFMKLETDNMIFTLKDEGSLTSLYEVTVYIDTIHELKNNVMLYPKLHTNFTLRTPLNRGYNSYEILTLNMTDTNKWELHYEIALLNTLLNDYGNDTNYILSELIDIFIEIKKEPKPPLEYYNFADIYGTYMSYLTLKLVDDFEFTDIWWVNGYDTYIFEYKPVEQLLEDLLICWGESTPFFMDIHNINTGSSYEYLYNINDIPINNLGWYHEDGFIYIIVKREHIDDNPEWTTPKQAINVISQIIRVDTWVITDSSPEYEEGYDIGYNNGYSDGYSNGFGAGDEQGYNRGYNNGYYFGFIDGDEQGYIRGFQDSEAYEQGYEDGANKSFMGSIDKWLVPSVIIVMLLGGFFAIARKKRDGDI